MIDYYKNSSSKNDCIPNLMGTWNAIGTVFPRKNENEQPNFNDIEVRIYRQEITQKGAFLIIKEETRTRMGVLTFMYGIWTLKIVDQYDNGVQTLIPKVSGDYTTWVGNYVEPGFDEITRIQQSQTVATIEMRRLNEYQCCCCMCSSCSSK